MQENRYVSDLSMLLRMMKDELARNGVSFPDKLSREQLGTIAADHLKMFHSQLGAGYWREYFESRNMSDPAAIEATMTEGIANTTLVLLSEILALFQGAVVHVEDAELVEALLRTELDANVGDVRVPFPIVELAYPSGIAATESYQVSGTIIIDLRQVNLVKEFKFLSPQGRSDPENKADIAVITKFKNADGTLGFSSHVTRVKASDPLSIGSVAPDINLSEEEGMKIHTRLAMAVLMYLQSVEQKKALQPMTGRSDCQGLIAPLARIEKKRQSYRVIDIAAKATHRVSVPGGGHHASPDAHWRKGHMRALRDERFKRDKNDMIRIIWIRPTKINADKDGDVTAERKLNVAERTV
jgi:hypothetical protein